MPEKSRSLASWLSKLNLESHEKSLRAAGFRSTRQLLALQVSDLDLLPDTMSFEDRRRLLLFVYQQKLAVPPRESVTSSAVAGVAPREPVTSSPAGAAGDESELGSVDSPMRRATSSRSKSKSHSNSGLTGAGVGFRSVSSSVQRAKNAPSQAKLAAERDLASAMTSSHVSSSGNGQRSRRTEGSGHGLQSPSLPSLSSVVRALKSAESTDPPATANGPLDETSDTQNLPESSDIISKARRRRRRKSASELCTDDAVDEHGPGLAAVDSNDTASSSTTGDTESGSEHCSIGDHVGSNVAATSSGGLSRAVTSPALADSNASLRTHLESLSRAPRDDSTLQSPDQRRRRRHKHRLENGGENDDQCAAVSGGAELRQLTRPGAVSPQLSARSIEPPPSPSSSVTSSRSNRSKARGGPNDAVDHGSSSSSKHHSRGGRRVVSPTAAPVLPSDNVGVARSRSSERELSVDGGRVPDGSPRLRKQHQPPPLSPAADDHYGRARRSSPTSQFGDQIGGNMGSPSQQPVQRRRRRRSGSHRDFFARENSEGGIFAVGSAASWSSLASSPRSNASPRSTRSTPRSIRSASPRSLLGDPLATEQTPSGGQGPPLPQHVPPLSNPRSRTSSLSYNVMRAEPELPDDDAKVDVRTAAEVAATMAANSGFAPLRSLNDSGSFSETSASSSRKRSGSNSSTTAGSASRPRSNSGSRPRSGSQSAALQEQAARHRSKSIDQQRSGAYAAVVMAGADGNSRPGDAVSTGLPASTPLGSSRQSASADSDYPETRTQRSRSLGSNSSGGGGGGGGGGVSSKSRTPRRGARSPSPRRGVRSPSPRSGARSPSPRRGARSPSPRRIVSPRSSSGPMSGSGHKGSRPASTSKRTSGRRARSSSKGTKTQGGPDTPNVNMPTDDGSSSPPPPMGLCDICGRLVDNDSSQSRLLCRMCAEDGDLVTHMSTAAAAVASAPPPAARGLGDLVALRTLSNVSATSDSDIIGPDTARRLREEQAGRQKQRRGGKQGVLGSPQEAEGHDQQSIVATDQVRVPRDRLLVDGLSVSTAGGGSGSAGPALGDGGGSPMSRSDSGSSHSELSSESRLIVFSMPGVANATQLAKNVILRVRVARRAAAGVWLLASSTSSNAPGDKSSNGLHDSEKTIDTNGSSTVTPGASSSRWASPISGPLDQLISYWDFPLSSNVSTVVQQIVASRPVIDAIRSVGATGFNCFALVLVPLRNKVVSAGPNGGPPPADRTTTSATAKSANLVPIHSLPAAATLGMCGLSVSDPLRTVLLVEAGPTDPGAVPVRLGLVDGGDLSNGGASADNGVPFVKSSGTRDLIKSVLQCAPLAEAFRRYLVHSFQAENFYFYMAVAQYHQVSDEAERKARAAELIDMFVARAAPYEINLPAGVRRSIESNVDQASVSLFDAAQSIVADLMRHNAVRPFCEQAGCKELEQAPLY